MEEEEGGGTLHLSLEERLGHKHWKVRLQAYEELGQGMQTRSYGDDGMYAEYMGWMKSMVNDMNVVAQEKGLDVLQVFLTKADVAVKTRQDVVPLLVEKCLGSSKASIKMKAMEVLLGYMELDKPDYVIDLLIQGTTKKQPKIVSACLQTMSEAVKGFGVKVVPCTSLLKILTDLFQHSDKNVRTDVFQLTLALYPWMGEGLKRYLEGLKPVQLKELEDAFQIIREENKKPVQQRFLKSQRAAMAAAAALANGQDAWNETSSLGKEEGGVGEDEEEDFDITELAEPQPVLSRLSKTFFDEVASTKWKERKEALDHLLSLLKGPKLVQEDYGDLIRALKTCLGDSNVLVIITTANCIEKLALGLKASFHSYISLILPSLIEGLKEKKKNVVDALRLALDALFMTTQDMNEILEDVGNGMAQKNPNMKSESLLWVVRCLKNTKKELSRNEVKTLGALSANGLNDSAPEVRETAAEVMGTLMKIVGEQPLLIHMEGMDSIKQGKIKEYCDKAEVKYKPGKSKVTTSIQNKPVKANKENSPPRQVAGKFKATAKPTASTIAPLRASEQPRTSIPSLTKKPVILPNRVATTAPNATNKVKPPVPSSAKSFGSSAIANHGYTMPALQLSESEAERRFEEVIPESIRNRLSDSIWKMRLEASDELFTLLQEIKNPSLTSEVIYLSLRKAPGWKESNFQVMGRMIAIFDLVASTFDDFNASVADLVANVLFEKLSDIKLKQGSFDCLMKFSERLGFNFMLVQVLQSLKDQKNPKIVADMLIFLSNLAIEFGARELKSVPDTDLNNLLKAVLVRIEDRTPDVRKGAQSFMINLSFLLGPENVRKRIESMKLPNASSALTFLDKNKSKIATPELLTTGSRLPSSGIRPVLPAQPVVPEDAIESRLPINAMGSKPQLAKNSTLLPSLPHPSMKSPITSNGNGNIPGTTSDYTAVLNKSKDILTSSAFGIKYRDTTVPLAGQVLHEEDNEEDQTNVVSPSRGTLPPSIASKISSSFPTHSVSSSIISNDTHKMDHPSAASFSKASESTQNILSKTFSPLTMPSSTSTMPLPPRPIPKMDTETSLESIKERLARIKESMALKTSGL